MSEEKGDNKDMAPKQNGNEPMDHSDSTNKDDELDAETALEEIASVNNSLDELSSYLGNMEQRTDEIKAELMELLKSNREIREGIMEENKNDKPEQNQ